MSCPLVSIIVPIYSVEKYLDRCVESIVEQTYKNLEIILVDDGSPDNCPAICDAWAVKDSRIQVIHKENGGVSDARNAGLKIATGEWLLFVDSDDIISVYLVDLLVQSSTISNILTIAGFARFTDTQPDDDLVNAIPRNCGKKLTVGRGGMYCCAALYNRALVNNIGLWFDPTLRNLEDVAWNSMYLRYIESVQYIPVPLYYYRVNPTSITSRCVDKQWQVSSWIAARKSILNWFADKSLTKQQVNEVYGAFRHCQNNIYAECLAGNIPYKQFIQLEIISKGNISRNETNIWILERIIITHFPKMYFQTYLMALRMRRFLSR